MVWVMVTVLCYLGISVLWKYRTEQGFMDGFVQGFRDAAGRDPSEDELAKFRTTVWVAAFMWPVQLPTTLLRLLSK